MSPIVTVVEVGRGVGEGVALRRTAGRGHSIINTTNRTVKSSETRRKIHRRTQIWVFRLARKDRIFYVTNCDSG